MDTYVLQLHLPTLGNLASAEGLSHLAYSRKKANFLSNSVRDGCLLQSVRSLGSGWCCGSVTVWRDKEEVEKSTGNAGYE